MVARVERREEVHPPSLKGINGNGNGSPTQPPLLTPVKASPETQQLARRLWKILDSGFGGLTDPKPTWKRPTEYAVLRVLERHQPGPIIAEEAAREARRTLQQREDGRNVVGLFEHKLKVQLDKQAGVHRQVVKSFGEAAAS